MKKRILRVNQLIQKELSNILLREIEFPLSTLVTVTRVEVSPDFNLAKVYISCLPEKNSSLILRTLKNQIYHLQQELNKRLTMKIVPRIEFVEEFKTKEAGKIEELLERIKKLKQETK
jgi:ribosome-binding factor A